MDMWYELADNDEDSREEFNRVFNNTDVNQADDVFIANLYDQFLNMELTLDQGGDRPKVARVKKILKDAHFRPIGVANNNPILESLMY